MSLSHTLKEIIPGIVNGTINNRSTLKPGQKIILEKHKGTVKEVGIFQIIIENEEGKSIIIPTKSIADHEIIIEGGPSPETPEKKIQKMAEEVENKYLDDNISENNTKK